jgi:hypothetical protein
MNQTVMNRLPVAIAILIFVATVLYFLASIADAQPNNPTVPDRPPAECENLEDGSAVCRWDPPGE